MSAERFFDDLARTLAEPMPRRRAVRVIGASLAAIAVPGLRPRIARAEPSACSHGAPNVAVCQIDRYPKAAELYCCPPPGPRYGCGDADNGFKCRDRCPPVNPVTRQNQEFCFSKAKAPLDSNTPGWPLRYACCTRPDTICDDDGGDCVVNCKYAFGREAVQCGKNCCMPGEVCKNGKCIPCPNTCKPQNGKAKCCERGTTCCFNDTSADCCGPKQTCNAQNVTQAKCTCDKGKKCGPDCCEKKKGQVCCGGNECCAKGETCCKGECCGNGDTCEANGCCPKGRAICRAGGTSAKTSGTCCGVGEFCFWKVDSGLVPLSGTCKKGCAPGNRAGTQCCGAGFKPNGRKTACVPA